MDSTLLTTGEAAERLGVSIPTVHRLVDRLGLAPSRTPGGQLRLAPSEVAAMIREVGATPRIDGLTRSEVQVLAALSRSPLGLRSTRAVGRAAGLSPTAAGRALRALESKHMARVDRRVLAEGRAVVADVWTIDLTAEWLAVAPTVGAVVLPVPVRRERHSAGVPRRFWHLFWNATPSELALDRDADLVATRLMLSSDVQALAWAIAHLPPSALRHAVSRRGVQPAVRSLVENAIAA